jgi:hypothetical protein
MALAGSSNYLLLVSRSLLSSNYCDEIEMQEVLKRHEEGEVGSFNCEYAKEQRFMHDFLCQDTQNPGVLFVFF